MIQKLLVVFPIAVAITACFSAGESSKIPQLLFDQVQIGCIPCDRTYSCVIRDPAGQEQTRSVSAKSDGEDCVVEKTRLKCDRTFVAEESGQIGNWSGGIGEPISACLNGYCFTCTASSESYSPPERSSGGTERDSGSPGTSTPDVPLGGEDASPE